MSCDLCDFGWIEYTYVIVEERTQRDGTRTSHQKEYSGVRPCPTCDPERAQIFENSESREELQRRLMERSSHKKVDAVIQQERNKTRIL